MLDLKDHICVLEVARFSYKDALEFKKLRFKFN